MYRRGGRAGERDRGKGARRGSRESLGGTFYPTVQISKQTWGSGKCPVQVAIRTPLSLTPSTQHPAPPPHPTLTIVIPLFLNKLRRWAVSSPLYDTSSRNHDYFVARLGMVAFKPNGFQSPSRTSTYSCVELTMGSEVPASVNAEKVYISMIAPVAKCRLLTCICQIIATE